MPGGCLLEIGLLKTEIEMFKFIFHFVIFLFLIRILGFHHTCTWDWDLGVFGPPPLKVPKLYPHFTILNLILNGWFQVVIVIVVWCIRTPAKKSSDDNVSQTEATVAAVGNHGDTANTCNQGNENTMQCENRIQFLNMGIYP